MVVIIIIIIYNILYSTPNTYYQGWDFIAIKIT